MSATAAASAAMPELENPILRGFNPDPSICRVGDDYYIATSTFEWYPGVQVHHSRDLRHWRLVARPLDRASLLDLRGVPDSCGVWAPCLSHADGKFWLVYTVVRRFDGDFKDTHNYLTQCATIDGTWSEPVYLDSRGFDPSLFHDDDGRKWYLSMIWDHRPGRNRFGGIQLREYSASRQCLTGDSKLVFAGTELGCTEGPHLYRHDGYYYLLTAEGGTGYDHAVTAARARRIEGPYEADPAGPFITARDHPEAPLQRCGHGDLVTTAAGDWHCVHLCSRPLAANLRRSPLGRETAITPIHWNADGWPRAGVSKATVDGGGAALARRTDDRFGREGSKAAVGRGSAVPASRTDGQCRSGEPEAAVNGGSAVLAGRADDRSGAGVSKATPARLPAPALAPHPWPSPTARRGFDGATLPPEFQWLRTPQPERLFSLTARRGWLRLHGREAPASLFESALVARRVQAFSWEAGTEMSFAPANFQQLAGLICYYNGHKFHYLFASRDEERGRHLAVMSCLGDLSLATHWPLRDTPLPLPDEGPVLLRAVARHAELDFSWSADGRDWHAVGPTLDFSLLSDEAGKGDGANFTGAFVGMSCQDLTGAGHPADFRYFEYRES